jgi:carboxyl-terminal processing protease
MRRALSLLFVGGFGFAAAFALAVVVAHDHRHAATVRAESVVDRVRAELVSSYYRPVPASVLARGTVASIIAALQDPYTEYLNPAAYSLLQQEVSASYSGVGITVLPSRDGLDVVSVEDGPAREAGVRPGDVIVGINGGTVRGLPYELALGRILGPLGTTIRLDVVRGNRALAFSMTRRRISAPVVRSRVLVGSLGSVGYLRLSAFRTGSAQVLRKALMRLERAQVSAVVLDLRENPGGLLDQAVAVASLFLERGVVVSVQGAHRHREVLSANGRRSATRLPLVVLVDRFSASAAEVVAAALHDNHRAELVGESTYGKALVQEIEPLPGGAALKLTTARYLTPDGVDISHQGIRPDVVAADDPRTPIDETLAAALRTLSD